MFETLKRLYNEGRLNKKGIDNAVTNGWISEVQKKEIIGID